MKFPVRPATAVLVLGLVCLACDGGGGGGPTAPPPPSGKQLQFNVHALPDFLSGGAIQEGAVFLDGREVGRVDWSRTGGACTVLCIITVNAQEIGAGNHTVRFTVVRQNRAVVNYTVTFSGVLVDRQSGQQDPINAQQRTPLRAGESVTFNVRV